jgi:hypothetical protein
VTESRTAVLTRSVTEVMNEPDIGRRAELIARTYAPDFVFHDPEGSVVGWAPFSAHLQPLLDGVVGMVFSLRRPIQESVDLAVAHWALGPAGGSPVTTGMDVALFRDGRIATMWTMVDR